MTTFAISEVKCGLCGRPESVRRITSTHQFDAPDLDLRPPEPMRSFMAVMLQECQGCGLVAYELAEPPRGARQIIALDEYKKRRAHKSAPELYGRFLAHAYLCEQLGQAMQAARSTLHAAWVADDAGATELATDTRLNAAREFETLHEQHALWPDQPGQAEVFLADVYRRAGRFKKAHGYAQAASEAGADDQIVVIAEFQQSRCEARDSGRYTTDFVPKSIARKKAGWYRLLLGRFQFD